MSAVVVLSPIGGSGQQFFDNNGDILSGGKIYTYAAGSTTPLATYTDSTGNTPNANPVVLNSAGRVASGGVWLVSGSAYKIVLTDSDGIVLGVTYGTWDNLLMYQGATAAQASQITAAYTFSTDLAATSSLASPALTNYTITLATDTKLTFDVEAYDRGNNYSTVDSRFTAPADGTYMISAMCDASKATPVVGELFEANVRKNGVEYAYGTAGYIVSTSIPRVDSIVSVPIYLLAGDYIEIWGIGLGAAGNWVFNSSGRSQFSVARVS